VEKPGKWWSTGFVCNEEKSIGELIQFETPEFAIQKAGARNTYIVELWFMRSYENMGLFKTSVAEKSSTNVHSEQRNTFDGLWQHHMSIPCSEIIATVQVVGRRFPQLQVNVSRFIDSQGSMDKAAPDAKAAAAPQDLWGNLASVIGIGRGPPPPPPPPPPQGVSLRGSHKVKVLGIYIRPG